MHWRSFVLLAALLVAASPFATPALAQTPEEIKQQIEEHNSKINALEQEIAGYQKQLNVLGGQRQTLQSAISSIDVSRKQTATQINVTQNKISKSNLRLNELAYEIKDTEDLIELDHRTIARSLQDVAIAGDTSLMEQVLAADSLTDAWTAVDTATMLTQALRISVQNLSSAKQELTVQHESVAKTKDELTNLKTDLTNAKKSLDIAKAEKDKLLSQTKNQESTYQALIAKKRAEQKVFEAALNNLESSLASVGQGSIPTSGTGILVWPYSSTFAASCVGKAGALGNPFCVTQYFGNTPFSTANAQIYNGAGHNAIDIGMPTGTSVLSALSGTVLATGNTDAVPGCYSFGKWVVVKHGNGLATLYAHLSSISVSKGQAVSTGQLLGYSGMTGYATGPHLHFAVYASAGVQIMDLGAWRRQNGQAAGSGCAAGGAVIPVAPKDAYLNPMSYL